MAFLVDNVLYVPSPQSVRFVGLPTDNSEVEFSTLRSLCLAIDKPEQMAKLGHDR